MLYMQSLPCGLCSWYIQEVTYDLKQLFGRIRFHKAAAKSHF